MRAKILQSEKGVGDQTTAILLASLPEHDTTSDCKKAIELLAGFKGKCVLADKGHDSDEM